MNKTSLHTDHLSLGAKMGEFAGWDMPLQYTGVKQEVLAVRQAAGMFDVSHMGEFWVHGPDAVSFIDSLITNDFSNAPIGKAVYSPLCRHDGSVIDDLIVYKLANDNVLICVNASNIKKDWDWISAQSEGKQIDLVDRSQETSLIALQGPKSNQVLRELGVEHNLETYAVAFCPSSYGEVLVARTGYTGEDGFEIFCNHEQAQNIWRALHVQGVSPCGLAARDVLRLEACYPLYGHELSDEWTPLDAGLKWTVKLQKDDFIGKNALINYQPRFKLIKLVLERGIPRDNYIVKDTNQNIIGKVSSGTMSVVLNKGIALALVDAAKAPSAGESVFVTIRNQDYSATCVKEAFLKGGKK
jgi:aminomethyltransferase